MNRLMPVDRRFRFRQTSRMLITLPQARRSSVSRRMRSRLHEAALGRVCFSNIGIKRAQHDRPILPDAVDRFWVQGEERCNHVDVGFFVPLSLEIQGTT